jgi:mRNA interferase MazF
MASTEEPRRGEIWVVAFGAGRRGEPGKNRPAIVLSADGLIASSDDELIVTIPLSSSLAPSNLRPTIAATAGIDAESAAIPRGVRGVARSRLLRRIGVVDRETLAAVERALKLVLSFDPNTDSR